MSTTFTDVVDHAWHTMPAARFCKSCRWTAYGV